MKRYLTAAAAACLFACVTATSPTRDYAANHPPSTENPIPMCHISCPRLEGRMIFRAQHLCSGSTRQFEDFTAIGENVTRGADGVVVSAYWISGIRHRDQSVDGWSWQKAIDFEKSDVEVGTCSQVIDRIIAARSMTERGQYPGEDPQGNPLPPN